MGNWAELPADMLVLIANQLTLFEDFLFFGGVCRSWRSVAIQDNFKGSEQIPWLMLSNNDKPNEQLFISLRKGSVIRRVNLPEVRGKQCMETLGWLVIIAANGDIDLLHPFTRVQIHLPCLITCKDNRVKRMNESIQKALLSSSPEESKDFLLVVVYGRGYLAFWRYGDKFWTDVEVPIASFVDVIFYKGLFYGVVRAGMVFAFDILGPDRTQPLMVLDRPDTFNFEMYGRLYLIKSEGVLLLVSQDLGMPIFRYAEHRTCRFHVFEATLTEKGKWVKITSLGDKALFLGGNASVAVDATRFPGIKANCIYYAGKYWPFPQEGVRHTGIYCLKDGSRSHCYDEQSFNPFYPPLWVNPPSF